MRKLLINKKGRYAIPFALAYVFFNILLFIIITAFAKGGESVGVAGSTALSINASSGEDITTSKATGWLSGFKTVFYDLPWWINTLFVTFEIGGLALIILAIIRGL